MRESEAWSLIWLAFVSWIFGSAAFIQGRFLLRRYQRHQWPMVDASVQRGAIGRISFGRRGSARAAYMGYAFSVKGIRYVGFFALYGDENRVQNSYEALGGQSIQIRYKPSDPNVSFLSDNKDLRFAGLKITETPDFLNQAPAFDLQDAIRGNAE